MSGKKELTEQEKRVLKSCMADDSVDLWSKIERRIDAEERAAIFLGKRSAGEQSRVPFLSRFFWGGAGALAAACLVLFISTGPTQETSVPANQTRAAIERAPGIQTVALNSAPMGAPQKAIELDWIRSAGRVRMIPYAEEELPVIWISQGNQGNSSGIRMIEDSVPQTFTVSNR